MREFGFLTRRGFLSGLTAAGAELALGAAPTAGRRALLRVGVLSDIHIRKSALVDTGRDGWGTDRLVKVMSAYRDAGADAIMIPGDMADWGLVSQLKEVGLAWEKVFPDGRGADGRKVEKLFIYGNHDSCPAFSFSEKDLVAKYLGLPDAAAREAYARTEGISVDRAKAWEEAFHEAWSPVSVKEVNGFTFVGVSWGSEGKAAAAVVSKLASAADPKKPFFVYQHRALGGTCWSARGIPPRSLDADDGSMTAVLSKFPNAIALAGHNHYTLADPDEVWRGPFTALGCSSLRFVGRVPPAGGWPKGTKFWDSHVPSVYQSLFLTVCDDETVIEAHEWREGAQGRTDVVPAWHVRRPIV